MASKKTKRKVTRLNLELTEALRHDLESLRVDTEAASSSEVIRRAVRLYRRIVDAEYDGKKVFMRDERSGHETELLVL